jgi:Helitron helicase-like domain at N-terminus
MNNLIGDKLSYLPTVDVIPLKFCGVEDTDLSDVSMNELMTYALANLTDEQAEGGYIVRHHRPVSEFGHPKPGTVNGPVRNPLMAAYPCLWPFGIGGIESDQDETVSFNGHVKWALQYYDRRFRTHHSFPFVAFGIKQKREAMQSARLQMQRRDFETDTLALSSLTVEDLRQAAREEERKEPISNPRVRLLRKHISAVSGRVVGSNSSRAAYRGQIWGTCLYLNPPSIWITINPVDIHDPVAQVFAGENIDMDRFISTCGPDSDQRARNIAKDPYAAAKFFHYIIYATLETLFGIKVIRNRVCSDVGIFGRVSGYHGVVEAQGRGALHVHMMLWLLGSPNAAEMQSLLQGAPFRQRIIRFIEENIRAHLDAFGAEEIRSTRADSTFPYSRPPNPDDEDWSVQVEKMERHAIRSQQIHTCTKNTCLVKRHGNEIVCKRRAPWELHNGNSIDPLGNWHSKRTYGYINSYCPTVSVNVRCNNDIKLITNGEETKAVTWYTTGYQTKKQGKGFNVSGLLATGMLYHRNHSQHIEDLREKNRLLVFRCLQTLNREMELAAPQVHSYLMGWGDTFRSHYYVNVYWASLSRLLLQTYPYLRKRKRW